MAEKRRPALIVSDAEVQRTLTRVWVVMITSAVNSAGFADALISDLQVAGLPAPSLLRASKIATLDAERVIRRAGRLSEDDCARARLVLALCWGG